MGIAERRKSAAVSRTGWRKKTDQEKLEICTQSIVETNFVSTFNLTSPLVDTRSIADRLVGANYNPTFDSIVTTLLSPPVTATVYSTGSIVLMGVNSKTRAVLAARKMAYIIANNVRPGHYVSGEPVVHTVSHISVHNVVGTVLAFPVCVDKLMSKWGHALERHEHFSGITLSCARLEITPPTNIVITIYPDTGKLIITGARTREEMRPVYAYVHEHVLQPAERKDAEFAQPPDAPSPVFADTGADDEDSSDSDSDDPDVDDSDSDDSVD